MNLKPYPKYKDSGIEWLGEIPEGWEIRKLKYVANIEMGQSPDSDFYNKEGNGVPFLQGNADFKEIYPQPQVWTTEGNKYSKKDDILVSVRAPVGEINMSDNRYAIGRGLVAIGYNEKSDFKYYYYLFTVAKNYFDSIATGTTYSAISTDDVKNIVVAVPLLEKQIQISNYLDHQTNRIDELIEKNERLIELLKEKRQAIISHAVTKRLDPNAKVKDSGIEWMGEIPEGWEVKRLKYVCMINPPKSQYKGSKNIEVTFLPMEKVGEQGEINKNETRNFKDVCNGYTYFENSDVLVAKITPCFENGKGCFVQGLSNGIGFGSTEFHVLRANKKVMPEYLYLITYSYPFRKMGEIMLIGAAGQKRVPEDFVKNFSIGIPPLTEQIQILNKLKRELQQIELIITKSQSQIATLKEYRQALISNVVTGKVRVAE